MQNNETAYTTGDNCQIFTGCTLGLKYKEGCKPTRIGANAVIRTGTIIYADVIIGDYCQTGHNALIREHTQIGNHVVIGTNSIIDGQVSVGNFVKIESNCYIPTHTRIGNKVFFGPGVVLTNDRYPLKMRDQYKPEGPIIEDEVTIGAGCTICPGVIIGKGSFIAAGTVVTKTIPPMSLVMGAGGRILPLPKKLQETNIALSWRKYLQCEVV